MNMNTQRFTIFVKLTEAFIERAEAMGKKAEAQAFIARMNKDCPNWVEYERAITSAWVDGLRSGNWPWVKP